MGIKDIEEVIISACEGLGIVPLDRIYVTEDFPEGVDERIVIHAKQQQRGDYFYKGFVEVNAVVPDIFGKADHARLQEIEGIFTGAFKYDTVGTHGTDTYRYGLESERILSEEKSEYHYVNARLLFEILNI